MVNLISARALLTVINIPEGLLSINGLDKLSSMRYQLSKLLLEHQAKLMMSEKCFYNTSPEPQHSYEYPLFAMRGMLYWYKL